MLANGINFNLLIICILLICIWFYMESHKNKTATRNIFVSFMWFAILMYLNRIAGICFEAGYFPKNNLLMIFQKMIHYVCAGGLYSFYAFFMGNLLFEFGVWKTWKKLLFVAPTYVLDILIISSPWTGLIFTYDNGTFGIGKLMWLMYVIRIGYGVGGTLLALSKRKLLPNIFSKCIYLVAACTIIEYTHLAYTGDEILFYSTAATNIVILVFALTIIELYRDGQTGLLNEEAFEQYINREINKRRNKALYLIKLKNYNYLKDNSNELALKGTIKELSKIILEYSNIPSAYYLGNGRFVLIVPKRSKFKEEDFIEQLESRFNIPFDVNGANISLSVFVAVIQMFDEKINNKNFWKFFSACDSLKYKSNGPVEVIYGDNFGVDQLQRYKDVEEAIERALIEKEFRMFYQPIVSTETNKVISCEALIRLNDRLLGFVSPEEFIPISEGNGSILDISEFVIDSVFSFVAKNDLDSLGIEYVEMNLSMIQCMDEKLPEKLQFYSEKYNVNPNKINLEITETATNFDEKSLKKQLMIIKNLGFSFSLDDFGTGYSNLVRVLEFPVDIIKLDKVIIWSAFHNSDNYATLKNLITMFHDVRRKLIAEGVENEEQKNKLIDIGCDMLQGYYYSKPVPDEDFLKFVNKFNGITDVLHKSL